MSFSLLVMTLIIYEIYFNIAKFTLVLSTIIYSHQNEVI